MWDLDGIWGRDHGIGRRRSQRIRDPRHAATCAQLAAHAIAIPLKV
jgi:hypothetical protein